MIKGTYRKVRVTYLNNTQYIYNIIFGSAGSTSQPQIGYGALLSVVAAVIVGIVTGIYLFVSKKLDDVV